MVNFEAIVNEHRCLLKKKKNLRDVPVGPVVKTAPNAGDVVSIPGGGAEIPHALWPKKKKKERNRSDVVTSEVKTLQMVHFKKIFNSLSNRRHVCL